MQTECGLTGGPVGRSFLSSREVAMLIIIPYSAVHLVMHVFAGLEAVQRSRECIVCARAHVYRRQLFEGFKG